MKIRQVLTVALILSFSTLLGDEPERFETGDILRLVLQRSVAVRDQELQARTADTDLMHQEGIYTTRPYALAERDDRRNRLLSSGSSTSGGSTSTGIIADGVDFHQRTLTAGVTRQFSSGTSIGLSSTDNRFEFMPPNVHPSPSPFHRDDLTLSISQDLLRNGFGYSMRRQYDIARENSLAIREAIADQISRSVAGSLVDFWNLAYSSENLDIARQQLESSRYIRTIVHQRVNIGLSEDYEIYQWNNNVISAEIQLRSVETDRESRRIDLLRTMFLDSGFENPGSLVLVDTMPEGVDETRDMDLALERRLDLRSVRRRRANARTAVEVAQNNMMPSVTLNGTYSSRDWGRHAREAYGEVPYGMYPQSSVQLRVDVPLWDEGLRVDARNVGIQFERLKLQEEALTRQVRDDVRKSIIALRNSFQTLTQAKEAMQQADAYYNRVLMRFSQGRAQTIVLFIALNAKIQARTNVNLAKVNYNIALVQYDVARNFLFERYGIDPASALRGPE